MCWEVKFVLVLQGKRSDAGSGGESPAAADGDNSGDAGRPAGGGDGSREEAARQVGRSDLDLSSY